MRLKFFFCFKRMKAIQAIKIAMSLEVIPLRNADSFLLQDNAIFLHLESLKK